MGLVQRDAVAKAVDRQVVTEVSLCEPKGEKARGDEKDVELCWGHVFGGLTIIAPTGGAEQHAGLGGEDTCVTAGGARGFGGAGSGGDEGKGETVGARRDGTSARQGREVV